jgi:hypothetical protein
MTTLVVPKVAIPETVMFLALNEPPTEKSPPVVVIPPDEASVVIPTV